EKGAVGLIVERLPQCAFNIPLIIVKDTVKALCEIASSYRKKFSIPLIAITGSNGKTTTKEMLAHLLSLRYRVLKNPGTQNNQIGLSLTLLKMDANYDFVVVELGSNHFGEIEYLSHIAHPNIGIVLNVGPAHLEFFHNLRGVYKEKISLIKNLSFPSIGILNNDDRFLRNVLERKRKEFLIGFGIRYKSDFHAYNLKAKKRGIDFLIDKEPFHLNTLGFFNVYNALAAITTCRLFGFQYRDLSGGLKSFEFPNQRLKIRKIKGITFIDDTYNSNPNSLMEALKVIKRLKTGGRKIAVLGDMLELGRRAQQFHNQITKYVLRLCDIMIGVGDFFGRIDQIISKNSKRGRIILSCSKVEEAKEILFKVVKPKKDDIVLVKGSRLMHMEEIIKE
ncbi:MAG: UDP-N-acetylmuramoyl-tripeptide--D-alanyl-D-alanine ligase, partial [Candidatus Omnitrophica bacterium]|nr:UDP-N-acetylmuramoyl-tripeptide--D-alanyl-D-alanine ligase [Candidatus Omnitrophota bacterium]